MTTITEPDILCTDLVRIFSAQGIEVQALQGLNLRVDPGCAGRGGRGIRLRKVDAALNPVEP